MLKTRGVSEIFAITTEGLTKNLDKSRDMAAQDSVEESLCCPEVKPPGDPRSQNKGWRDDE